ncbi:carbamoyl phosphate synthase large subunit [Streptococcus danieliae]|uniref:Carbamoyl phosphate synthase large subunit n=1 Tax=Streptococcus danieliae TaxID=747656 RepID=A0A7X3KCA6_9STRE|nr:carbamoyl phosphate synthase large subunit [Streptococcus danieliae]MVX58403.1 carbamoyl phosphate synthase large subunit [Streptococcus danieliae]
MNYIVISPYYPQNFQKFSIELAKQGVTVLGIGQEPYEQLGHELQEAMTEYFRVSNLEDLDEVKRAVAFLFYKHGPIDRIESQNEYWLEMDAQLRTQFNVFGPKNGDIEKTKFKSKMKEIFRTAGVPVTPGRVVTTDEEVEEAVERLGLPLIAKPDNGVGAAATYKLDDPRSVRDFLENWDRSVAYFLEPFVTSTEMCTFDGLVDAEGNIVWSTSFDYTDTPLNILLQQKGFAYYTQMEVDPLLRQYGEAAVKAFGMKERFFHIEFFRNGDDYIAVEYNNRPAGAFAIDVYNFGYSRDLFRDYASLVAGNGFPEADGPVNHALAIARRDRFNYQISKEELLERYAANLKASLRMPEAFAELQGNDMFIFTSDNLNVIHNIIHDVETLAE